VSVRAQMPAGVQSPIRPAAIQAFAEAPSPKNAGGPRG
jgi:hypothetical protein